MLGGACKFENYLHMCYYDGVRCEGSATAYQFIKYGAKKVLLLEQLSVLHSRGSSHGSSRIIRHAHTKPYYNTMMEEAYRIWREVEKKSGEQLLVDAMLLPHTIETVSKFITRFLKGVSTTRSSCEPCLYSESPDEEPIIDRHPKYSNIFYATRFSSHGFQMCPIVGTMILELALDLYTSSYDATLFSFE